MKVIGITGGVGAGKSFILDFLKENYNCQIIIADDLAKTLYNKGERCYTPLLCLFGQGVLDETGEIDKKKMANLMYGHERLRKKVNSIIHPAVKEYILEKIEALKASGEVDFLFIEAALLIEDGYKKIVDELWYIFTKEEVRRERLKASRGYSDEKIDSIIASQLSEAEFRENSDFVIDNSGTMEESLLQIQKRMTLE